MRGRSGTSFGLLAIFLATAVILWLVFPKLYVFSDPTTYLMLANDLSAVGSWEMDHPFQHRLGLLAVHWLAYKVFGVNDLSSFIPQVGFFFVDFNLRILSSPDRSW